MSDSLYNGTDLNSVLRTLSTLTTPDVTPRETGTFDPQRTRPAATQYAQKATVAPPGKPAAKSSTVDPSTIMTWSAALRYVMTTVGQDEETQLRIRGLITSQHKHEKQWWQGRKALLERQRARDDKKKELDAVLLSIGAPVDSKSTILELEDYDRKVYQASVTMANALTAELRGLKIPFFVIQRSLIQEESAKAGPDDSSHDPSEKSQTRLTKSDLAELQRRMLGLLEDLCGE
ncbi:hypothetical protein PDE_00875 [Penicillium oxalicum 114-2]|uniref:Uncharacterized protein n=1 Tax=Penicillium oxalicum (strain 114-2 / CGMCC 5302) TaxID=933388 RepID=S7Z718_PENO1|nr:hypothetical protein PDE_00875 [Penicillium oxalicum 114-2]